MSPIVPDSDLPAVMRAALLLGTGGPEMLVVRDDVGVPSPGRGDVLVRVAACGMNNTDINTRVGWHSRAVTSATSGEGFDEAGVHDSGWGRRGLSFPRTQGADIAGTVVAAGDGADAGLLPTPTGAASTWSPTSWGETLSATGSRRWAAVVAT